MSKIAVFDSYVRKFTGDMIRWWEEHGHEVKFDTYYDPEKVQWADVVWFDTCDNNLLAATNPSQALLESPDTKHPWRLQDINMNGKKVIVRPIDIEVWQGHHAHEDMWQYVDDCIFIAPHIKDMMLADSRPQASKMNIHVIPCGVDLNRWIFRERKDGFKIGVVAERWVSKGVDYAVQLACRLKQLDSRYRIYWLGKNNDYHWEHTYLLDAIKRFQLPIVLEEDFVEDLDAWWEDKNYVLSCSKKEAFGYNIAEAMAKGIKPLIHTFYGYEPIWGDSGWTWLSIDECADLLTDGTYDSSAYRQYLTDRGYTLDKMMERIDAIIQA